MEKENKILTGYVASQERVDQKQKEELIINTIDNFVQLMKNVRSEQSLYEEMLKSKNNITSDFLHTLELSELTDDESQELLTKEVTNRRERRIVKDNLDILALMSKYITTFNIYQMLDGASKLVGELKKIKNSHENRVYRKRESINNAFLETVEDID